MLVHDSRGLIGEVDLLFEAALVVVEIDGHRVHGRREAFQRDRTKQNRLIASGYTVLRFTWDDLTRRPDAVEPDSLDTAETKRRLRAGFLCGSGIMP